MGEDNEKVSALDLIKEMEAIDKFRRQMKIVFETALNKAVSRCGKPGNSPEPWVDFTEEHLKERFMDEVEEWGVDEQPRELLDVINTAAFLFLRKTIHNPEFLTWGD